MAASGALVEARFPPSDRVDLDADGWLPVAEYDGPPCRLVIAQREDLRAIAIRGAPEGEVRIPWGPLDSINDAGAYRRLAGGVPTTDDSEVRMTIRLVGTSVRTSARWLSIDVEGGPHYEFRRSVLRGARLLRDGSLVAKGFRGKVIEVSTAATGLDAVVVSAVRTTLWSMLALPKLPDFVIPGD